MIDNSVLSVKCCFIICTILVLIVTLYLKSGTYTGMKRILLSVVIILFFSFSLFAQENKEKIVVPVPVSDTVPVIDISVVGNKIIIQNAVVGKRLEIYSVIGKKIGDIEIKHTSAEYPLTVPRGYYILKVEEIVRKVAIK